MNGDNLRAELKCSESTKDYRSFHIFSGVRERLLEAGTVIEILDYENQFHLFLREMAGKDLRYKILTIPRALEEPSKWVQLRDKIKAFRLESLKLDPDAFASTYADEVRFSNELWEKRMTNSLALHFTAVEVPAEEVSIGYELTTLLEGRWLGMLVVIGPKEDGTAGLHASRSPWDTAKPGKNDMDGAPESNTLPVYQLNGVFTIPEARGHGIGKALATTATAGAISSASTHGFKAIRMQVRVEEDNEPAKKLYSSCGYAAVGSETYTTKEKEKDGLKIPPKKGICIVMESLEDVN